MTVKEVIRKADSLYPNVFTFTQKALWLSELDSRVFAEICSRYDDSAEKMQDSYTENEEAVLLIGKPFEDIYIRYLVMNFDIVNSDIVRYQNSAALFNTMYTAFVNSYNRSHKFKKTKIKDASGG